MGETGGPILKDIRGLAKADWEVQRRRKYHDMNLLRWDGLNLRLKTGDQRR
jgi:hypothetical protein